MKYSYAVKCIIVDTNELLTFKFNRLIEAVQFAKFLVSHGDTATITSI